MSLDYKEIGRRIAARREQLGLKQSEVEVINIFLILSVESPFHLRKLLCDSLQHLKLHRMNF